ncbi:Sulfite reductase [NADPH] hemoprotein beta-component [Candidatus Hodgkinia cicadicola]|uniref:Sulfite reductase [NADPH] hemoprotein beta-component n=2 Tax=Candidatus Hodgkinia cicadicola TaxID=573658 RepID=A0ABX4MIP9_9HYPH|nr:Sulfite reductase [NADPH] hemoprotein beta-component [Candidatus Hodgkinia cicadicola]PIM95313.1 Sulfite reductase [NADPH] hemoprotein beta-component [Candidatus Hodgkinia cicadicola]
MIREFAGKYFVALIQWTSQLLSDSEFKSIRLLNGVYLQRHSYMVRFAIPCGVLNATQLYALSIASQKYDRWYFHVTTRQCVQFNWIQLRDTPQIMYALTKVGLWSAHTAGNCVRQITCNPKHGIGLDEQTDITDLMTELYNQFMLNERLIDLPKKVKISVRGNITDNNAGAFNDIGLRLMDKRVYVTVGGGLGTEPMVGIKFISLEKEYVSSWIATLLEVYRIFGINKQHPVRIKHLVKEVGKAELIKLTIGFPRIKTATPPKCPMDLRVKPVETIEWDNSEEFKTWFNTWTYPSKQPDFRHVELSCNSGIGAPGDIFAGEVDVIGKMVQLYCLNEIRLTQSQTLLLPYVCISNIKKVYEVCKRFIPTNIVCCPGLDYCNQANTRTIALAKKLEELKTNLKIRISGCSNGCSQHQIFDVGIVGVNKSGKEYYQIMIGGNGPNGILARTLCKAAPASEVPKIIKWLDKLIKYLKKDRFEKTYQCLERNIIELPENFLTNCT